MTVLSKWNGVYRSALKWMNGSDADADAESVNSIAYGDDYYAFV